MPVWQLLAVLFDSALKISNDKTDVCLHSKTSIPHLVGFKSMACAILQKPSCPYRAHFISAISTRSLAIIIPVPGPGIDGVRRPWLWHSFVQRRYVTL